MISSRKNKAPEFFFVADMDGRGHCNIREAVQFKSLSSAIKWADQQALKTGGRYMVASAYEENMLWWQKNQCERCGKEGTEQSVRTRPNAFFNGRAGPVLCGTPCTGIVIKDLRRLQSLESLKIEILQMERKLRNDRRTKSQDANHNPADQHQNKDNRSTPRLSGDHDDRSKKRRSK